MTVKPLQYEDIPNLEALQPPGWGDIRANFQYHTQSPICDPLKVVIDDKIAGVGTAIRHTDTAWLAMIIVDPAYRNRGAGKAITKALIDNLDEKHYKTIQLDATDLGYPVYLKNGFQVQTEYMHFNCENYIREQAISPFIVPFHEQLRKDILELDRRISGEGRAATLELYISTSFLYVENNNVQGFYIPALYDGVIIADNDTAGIELMKLRLKTKQMASVPVDNKAAIEFLRSHPFEYVRTSRRMIRGEKRKWKPEGIFNRISGALG
jgi:ribosomal protein S18 acetylase RimI-like enzyme